MEDFDRRRWLRVALCEDRLSQGDPAQACGRKQHNSNTALPFWFSIPTFWDSWAAASFLRDGKLRTATNLPSNKASSSPISPLWRGGYLKADLYTGARFHQGSPPKLLKRQWSGVGPPARRGLLKGKGILLPPQDKPSYLQPWLCCWTCIQFCLAASLHEAGQLNNSPRN